MYTFLRLVLIHAVNKVYKIIIFALPLHAAIRGGETPLLVRAVVVGANIDDVALVWTTYR